MHIATDFLFLDYNLSYGLLKISEFSGFMVDFHLSTLSEFQLKHMIKRGSEKVSVLIII